ncbi:2,4-dienoyl-CoA reductase [Tistlia consotensis]|uniref:2,4-dienoyl-CoA reductase n=1 Tax=Tistlia consotensis USBA 355 TaxID=560819 RepID=A0A1Y6BV01_9PROT|nr:FAD-dependent oxidoreductase [Tistlia consotensis]SMF30065.1 2,4-dienoyl-CoA reductase [Tistlia consotensis USBA 355]SNR90508.1 2,4-dienoyl-CoA reductase [Tistlia consotensis]
MSAAPARETPTRAATGPAAFPRLFSPVSLGPLGLDSRLVMAAMETNLAAADGGVTPELLAYYRERARGGAAMVTVEFTCVERREGLGSTPQLSLDSPHLIPGHARLAEAIRATGARACLQLHHAGRQTSPRLLGGRQPVAPSVVESWMFRTPPRALAAAEIERLVEAFARSAGWAVAAGYEAIELHGAHGYLLGQFLSPFTNRRDDAWGGDEARRLAFPTAVIRAVKARVGQAVPVIYRLSAEEFVEGGLTIAETERLAPALVAAGADALHVSTGVAERLDTNVDPISAPEGWRLPLARRIRAAVPVPVIGVGVIRKPELAEAALAAGDCDLVALGRALLADPDWPAKARAGQAAAIRPCTSCNWCIDRLARKLPVGCAENPRVGREQDPPLPRVGAGRRALVVGGGPGGLAAALLLEGCGFETTLAEARPRLGGGLVASATPPGKDKLFWYLDYLERRLAASTVRVMSGTRADRALLGTLDPAFLVLATGARTRAFPVEGAERSQVAQAYDLLMDPAALEALPAAGPVVVYGGGETGCETAELLAGRGLDVTLVTRSPARRMARAAEFVYRRRLVEAIRGNPRIAVRDECHLVSIGQGQVVLRDGAGREESLPALRVFLAQGRDAGSELEAAARELGLRHVVIGDAASIRRIGEAVNEAYLAVRELAAGEAPPALAC